MTLPIGHESSCGVAILPGLGLPGSGPAETHAFRLAQTLQAGGCQPTVLTSTAQGRDKDLQADGSYRFEGVCYRPVGRYVDRRSTFVRIVARLLGLGDPAMRHLREAAMRPSTIICLAPHSVALLRLGAWCRKNGVRLIPETMEWQDRRFVHRLFLWMDLELRMRFVQQRFGRIIVISSFLEKYYAACGCQVLRLPPVLDTQDARWRPGSAARDDSVLRLVFSGSLMRDRQDIVLGSILRARRKGVSVIIEYVGSTREGLGAMLPETSLLDELGAGVVCHGKVPVESVPQLLTRADYAVLLREDARWSRACFPSKVPEFLALGIPMICNITSDLGEYLRDGQEAHLIKEVSEEGFCEAILRAVSAKGEARARMGRLARRRAEESFDFRHFAKPLGDFVRSARM